jgi:hypothetical protein
MINFTDLKQRIVALSSLTAEERDFLLAVIDAAAPPAQQMPPLPEGVQAFSLEDPVAVHNAIAEAVGEPEAIIRHDRKGKRKLLMTRLQHCPCGSGEYPEALHDARGIFCCYVCSQCEKLQRSRYRPDVMTDPNYDHSEPIDEEE